MKIKMEKSGLIKEVDVRNSKAVEGWKTFKGLPGRFHITTDGHVFNQYGKLIATVIK